MSRSDSFLWKISKTFLLILGLFLCTDQLAAIGLYAQYNENTGKLNIHVTGVPKWGARCGKRSHIYLFIDDEFKYQGRGLLNHAFYLDNPIPGHTYSILMVEYKPKRLCGTIEHSGEQNEVKTLSFTMPSSMSGFTATQNNTAINLNWTAGGIKVTDYDLDVYLKDQAGQFRQLANNLDPSNSSSSYQISSIVQVGREYKFVLSQKYDGGNKALNAYLVVPLNNAWTFTNLHLEPKTNIDEIKVKWTDPSGTTAIRAAVDDWYYQLLRRERYLGASSWSSWSTKDASIGSGDQFRSPQEYTVSVQDCKEYEFQLKLYLSENTLTAGSPVVAFVNEQSQTIKYPNALGANNPPALSSFTASVPDVCKKEVKIEWNELGASDRHPCKEYWYDIIRYKKDSANNLINNSRKVIASRDNLTGANGKPRISKSGTAYTFTDRGTTDYNNQSAAFDSGANYRYYIVVYSRNVSNPSSPGTSYRSSGDPQQNITITGPIDESANSQSGITASIQEGTNPYIQLSWNDNVINESGFVIKRELLNGGEEKEVEVGKNITTYRDNDLGICKDYKYTIFAKNACDLKQIGAVQSTSNGQNLIIQKDIADTYLSDALTAYKGYAKDVVRLEWRIANNQESLTWQKIYRAPLGNASAKELLPAAANLPAEQTSFEDATANPNTLYRYFLIGEADCGESTILTNEVSDIGYRIPWGTISGNVAYEGNTAVPNCFMSATPASSLGLNRALYLDGSGARIIVPKPSGGALFGSNPRTLEAWVKLDQFNGSAIFSYGRNTSSQLLSLEVPPNDPSRNWKIRLHNDVIDFDLNVAPREWHHFVLTYANGILRLYVDGQLQDNGGSKREWSKSLNTGGSAQANYNIMVGGKTDQDNSSIIGHLDEIRMWSVARTEEDIQANYRSFLVGNEAKLKVYLRLDEGIGNKAYDHSYSGTSNFNEHHARLESGLENAWSTTVPPADKLGYNAITDVAGNYNIQFARYEESATGSRFQITPFIFGHEFSPTTRSVILRGTSQDKDDQNFEDISSFTVSGTVHYGKDLNGDGLVNGTELKCPAEGIAIKVDGVLQVNDETGAAISTDENGEFTVQVPIGEHYISMEKTGHDFAVGRWPATGRHDFQEAKSGLQFVDSTQVIVIGKMVGGTREGGKTSGLGASKNNIGTATIVFASTKSCYNDTIQTNTITGEYKLALFPLEYRVEGGVNLSNKEIFIASNPDIQHPVRSIDLTPNLPVQVLENNLQYHYLYDFAPHRTPHTLSVLDTETATAFGQGETEITVKDRYGVADTIPLGALEHPLFIKGEPYQALITVTEVYENKDNAANIIQDTVPVSDALLTIRNGLAEERDKVIQVDDSSGMVLYTFFGGEPGFTTNSSNPALDFLKTFEVTSEASGSSQSWNIMGYVLGSKPEGNSFATQGPDVVEHILRDPPGSNSFTELVKGTSLSSSTAMELMGEVGSNTQIGIHAGADFAIGVGLQVRTEIEASLSTEIDANTVAGGGKTFEETINIEQAISTNADPNYVGADADLFIGRSQNMDFGVADYLQLIDTTNCGGDVPCKEGINITGTSGKIYTVGRKTGFFMRPGGYGTYFAFSQKHIRDQLIPDLKRLRNQLLDDSPHYEVEFDDRDDNKFGRNNDDPVWGDLATPNPLVFEPADWNGPSYIFQKVFTEEEVQVDSVRWFNQQIRLWEEALRLNEQQKVNAVEGFAGIPNSGVAGSGILKDQEVDMINGDIGNVSLNSTGNISFNAGSTVNSSATLSNSIAWQFSWEVNLSTALSLGLGAKINGIGLEANQSFTVGMTKSNSKEKAATQDLTIGFTLADDGAENDGDFFSVDIFDGGNQNGPIFKTRGGKSSCPYEGEIVTQYFEPGTVIQQATIRRDQPGIVINPAQQVNVLSDESAVFQLTLANLNSSEDREYQLQVDESSNPSGAIIKIDGLSPNRNFTVLAGSDLTKTITVKRGPEAYNYENLRLILSSPCDDAIQVSETFSVKFFPVCSKVSLMSPLNLWRVNKSFKDTLPILFNDYNIGLSGLERISFQYKSLNSSTWIEQAVFYNKESAGGDTLLISQTAPYTSYNWNIKNLPDGKYELRMESVCADGTQRASAIHSGIIDRKSPQNFGRPSPGDEVLSPGDEIAINFNEEINSVRINKGTDLDIRGVLNGADIRHFTSVFFDGDDRMTIPPLNLQSRSFSVECWMKQAVGGAGIMLQQSNQLIIGIDSTNRLYALIGGRLYPSTGTVATGAWQHIALTYDEATKQLQWYINASSDATHLLGSTAPGWSQPIIVGDSYHGNLHDLRIWKTARSFSDIQRKYLKNLNPQQGSLMGYWPMDEGRGNVVKDMKGRRMANIEATWSFDQPTYALAFDGVDDYFKINTSTMIFDEETDFTLSFWFKGNEGANVTLLSNGPVEADGENNRGAWAIQTDANGRLYLKNGGTTDLQLGTGRYFDGQWHHVALVVQRYGFTKVYLDAALIASANSQRFGPLASAELYLGAYGRHIADVATIDQHFTGLVDEFRIWKSVRNQAQIDRDRYYNLKGDEYGLRGYFSFEEYKTDEIGIEILQESTEDQTDSLDLIYDKLEATISGATLATETPPIKMYRPVEKVNFDYVLNGDKLILTPATEDAARIENTTLDITVSNLEDEYGNRMESPVSWIAYVDKNLVHWEADEYQARILRAEDHIFTTEIKNDGGQPKPFTIENLPQWLELHGSPAFGTIAAQSAQTISFRVKPSLGIGTYIEDVGLTSDLGFEELLEITMEVYVESPEWEIEASDYGLRMNVVGSFSIDNILSTDRNDRIVAFINGELRGVAPLRHLPSNDTHLAFLTIYGDTPDTGAPIDFQIWDASTGEILTATESELTFSAHARWGTINAPKVFAARLTRQSIISLNAGWNWVSVNVLPDDPAVNTVLSSLSASTDDIFRNQHHEDTYTGTNWVGDLSNNGGVDINKGFRLRVDSAQTLVLSGEPINLSQTKIAVAAGQNWIPFFSNLIVPVNQALSSLESNDGDLIIGQQGFSVYNSGDGWIGSLTELSPGKSYLLDYSHHDTIVYTESRFIARVSQTMSLASRAKTEDLQVNAFSDNMSVLANIEADIDLQHYQLLAYDADRTLIGQSGWIQNAFYLTAYSNQDGQEMFFELRDTQTGEIRALEQTHHFEADGFVQLEFSWDN